MDKEPALPDDDRMEVEKDKPEPSIPGGPKRSRSVNRGRDDHAGKQPAKMSRSRSVSDLPGPAHSFCDTDVDWGGASSEEEHTMDHWEMFPFTANLKMTWAKALRECYLLLKPLWRSTRG